MVVERNQVSPTKIPETCSSGLKVAMPHKKKLAREK